MAYSREQLFERSGDLRPSKRFRDQKYFLGIAGTEARVSLLRRVADDDDGKFSVIRVVANAIEDRLAHVVGSAVQHQRVSVLLQKQFIAGLALGSSKG